MQKGLKKDSQKFNQVYSQIEKMVDQLGNMLHFNQKLTDTQKR